MKLLATSILFLQAALTSAIQLSISLPSSHSAALSASSIGTSAVLHSSPPIRARLSSRNDFTLNLSSLAGTEERYLLDVHSKQYAFIPLLVSLDASGDVKGVWEVRRGEAWGNDGEGMRGVEVKREGDVRSITARVAVTRDFYEVRPGFSPLSLLKSPMILLAIVGIGMAFGLPYLLENMDPETKAEFEAAQKQGGITSMLTGGGGGGSSGNGAGGKDDANAAAPAPAANPANFDLAGWMAGQQSKLGGRGGSGEAVETKSSGSDARGGGARRRG